MPEYTTVSQLISILAAMPPDYIVIVQSDPEGNSYSPLAGADDNASYDDAERRCGYAVLTIELRKKGYTDEDCVDGIPAVVLYPVY